MLNAMKSRLNGKTFPQTLFFFLLVTQIGFAQWVQVGLTDKSIKDIAVQNSTIFAVTSDSGKVFRSVNSGADWTMIVDSCALDVAISPTGKVFMVMDTVINNPTLYMRSLYYSLDNGNTWIWSDIVLQLEDSLWFSRPHTITISPAGNVFCGLKAICGVDAMGDRVAKSTDDGLNWVCPNSGMIGGWYFDFKEQFAITFGICDAGLYGYGSHLSLSTDYGNSWSLLESNMWWASDYALGLFTNGNIILNKCTWIDTILVNELYISMDMSSTWTKIAILNSQVGLSWSIGSLEGMLIGTDSLGVFLFSDEGDSLGSRNEGLTDLNVHTFTMDNNGYVYTGTNNGVWRRPLSEITPVEENQIKNPSSYNLSQNFPNPFNPSTKIIYSVPQSSTVIIKVFDILGNEIETLVNEVKPVGTYEITWYPDNLPSGIYFYQLKAGVYLSTKKMVLIK